MAKELKKLDVKQPKDVIPKFELPQPALKKVEERPMPDISEATTRTLWEWLSDQGRAVLSVLSIVPKALGAVQSVAAAVSGAKTTVVLLIVLAVLAIVLVVLLR